MKNQKILLISFLILAFALYISYFFFGHFSHIKNVQNLAGQILIINLSPKDNQDTRDWKVYQNEIFSLKYPSNWSSGTNPIEPPYNYFITQNQIGDGHIEFTIRIEDIPNKDLSYVSKDEKGKEYYHSPEEWVAGSYYIRGDELMIDSYQSYHYLTASSIEKPKKLSINSLIEKDGKIYKLSLTGNSTSVTFVTEKLFEDFVSNFKFIGGTDISQKEALEKVKAFPEVKEFLNEGESHFCRYDRDKTHTNEWVIECYYSQPKKVNFGWYKVNKSTGNISKM